MLTTRIPVAQRAIKEESGVRFKPNAITAALLASIGVMPAWAAPQAPIAVLDGWDKTNIAVNGVVTDITTSAIRGNTAFNQFDRFTVNAGNTVNLQVPTGAGTLVNLVHNAQTVINGTLNGLQDGKVAGNVIFADPRGMVVGSSGVINVGSLTVTTPSSDQMNELAAIARNGTGAQADAAAADLIAGGKHAGDGSLDIKGTINAGSVNLFAASAVVSGKVHVNAAAEVFNATVNTQGLAVGSSTKLQNGAITIQADKSVEVSGELAALMADSSGGSVSIKAPDIKVTGTGSIVTRSSAGKSGDINLQAASDISFTGRKSDGSEIKDLDELQAAIKAQAKPLLASNLGKAKVVIEQGAKLDAGHADDSKAGNIKVEALGVDKQLGGYADASATIDVAGQLIGKDISLRAVSDASVSADILGSLLDTTTLKADIARLKDLNKWSDAQTWSYLFENLGGAVNSYKRTTDLSLLMQNPENFSELTALLPYVSAAIAQAEARISIAGSADLQATGALDMRAESTRFADTSTWSVPILNGKLPFNFGLAYGRLSGDTKVEVLSGAKLSAHDLTLLAHSNNELAVSATSVNSHDGNGSTLTTMGLAFGMAHTELTTTAKVAHGAVLNIGNDVSVMALTEQDLSNEVSFKAIGEGASGGPAVALTLFNSKTLAAFDADLSGARNLNVTAANLVSQQDNSASVQVGKASMDHLKANLMKQEDFKKFTDDIAAKVKKFFGMKPGEPTQPTESKFRLASALAIGIADHKVEAIIGSAGAPKLELTGDLAVAALQQQSALHNSADSTVNANVDKGDGTKTAISIAASYNQLTQNTRALIGDGVNIKAAHIGVDAHNVQSLDLGTLTRWGSLDEVFTNLKNVATSLPDIPGQLSTVYANSTSESEEFSLAGSLTVLNTDINALAWVGDNVTLEATSQADAWSSSPFAVLAKLMVDGKEDKDRKALRELQWSWSAPLQVQARNEIEQLAIAGNLWWSLFNNTSDGKAAGAGLNIQVSSNEAVAGIGAKGNLTAQKVAVNAQQDELIIGITPTAGKGASAAGTGSLVVSVVNSNVRASIHSSTAITAAQVGVAAEHRLGLWSAAGALAASETTGVGASVAVNVLTTDVQALVGNNSAWRPADWVAGGSSAIKGQWKVDEVLVNAESNGQSGAFSVAAALARTEKEKEEQDKAAAEEGKADSGAMSLAEGLGKAVLQALFGDTSKGVQSGLDTAKNGATSIKDTVVSVPDKLSEVWGKVKGLFDEKPDPGTGNTPLTLAVTGSASVNVSGQKTRAQLGDIVLDPRDPLTKGSKVTVLSLNQTNQLSGSGSGALTMAGGQRSERSSALAGAIAYNHLFNVTESLLQNATLTGNDSLKVQAASAGDQVAMGLGLAAATAGNDNTSVALSASGGVIMNTTRAAVIDSSIAQREEGTEGIAVTAYDRARVLLGGGAFSFASGANGSGTSAGGSLVFGLLMNKLNAEWLGSSATDFARLDVSANSAARALAGAIAGAVSTGQNGKSGSGAINLLLLDNDVSARVDKSASKTSSLQGGAVNVNAQSVSGLSALDDIFEKAGLTALSKTGLDLDGKDTVGQIDGSIDTKDGLFEEDGKSTSTSSKGLFNGELAGEAVLAVAGNLAATSGQTAVGGAVSIVYTASDYSASLANTSVDLTGDLSVVASNNTDVLAAAIGAAGAKENAVSGSSTVVVARGSVTANVDMTGRTLVADGLLVQAYKRGGAYSLAGNITGSANNASIGGAIALSDMQQSASAKANGGTYTLGGDAEIAAGLQSRIITAALSGQVSGSGSAIGGALTYNRIADTTSALLSNASMTANNLKITASQPDLGASIWAIAFNLSAAGGAAGVGGAVAVNLIDATRSAGLTGSTVNLDGAAELSSSLDGEIWGLGVDAAGGNTAGVGGSIVVNVIDGEDEVLIDDSTLTGTDTLKLDASAGKGLTIASLTGSIKGGGTAAVGGAISVNRIGADRVALIRDANVSGFSSATLKSGAKQTIYAIAVAGGGAGTVAVNGSSTSNVLEGTERAAIEDSTLEVGSLELSAAEGDRTIWSLAGAVSGAGTTAVGVANANNIILAKRVAEVIDSNITVDGALQVRSGGAAHIRSAAVGGGGAGTAAVGASIAINVIEGEERALIDGSEIEAGSLAVEVLRGDADIKTLAGNVQGAGTGAGAGAIAVSTVKQKRIARIVDSSIELASGNARVEAATNATINTLALSGAGGGTAGVAFSNTSNNIAAETRALVESSDGTAGTLQILASDASTINAIAGSAAGGGTAAVGGGTAINRVESKIEAALTGSRNTGWGLTNLLLDAHSAAKITAGAVAAGGSGTAAAMVVAATNIIQTQASAHIGGGAQVLAQHNIGISARNIDSILGSALAAAVSGNAAVSAIATVNLIETNTRAYIDGAATRVSALATDASDTLLIDDGSLKNAPSSDHKWISGEQFNPAPSLAINQHRVTGLAVQASSIQQVGQLALSASVGVVPLAGASVSGVANSTVLGGSTRSYIDGATINQASGAGSAQNVRVGANSHSYTAGYLAAVAVGASAAGVSAAIDATVNSRETQAYLRNATLNSKGSSQVLAGSSQYVSTIIGNVAGALVGVGASSSLVILKGKTEALIDGTSKLDVGSLKVKADALQSLLPNAVSVSGGAVAVSGALGVLYNQSTTRAWVGSSLKDAALATGSRSSVQGGAVEIAASNDTRLLMNIASAGGGAAAVGGSIGISVLETVTEAGASQVDFGSNANKLGALTIKASDSLSSLSNVGSAQVGGVSAGASANVLVANSAVRALFDRSSLKGSAFTLEALRKGDIQLNTLTGSVGSSALGGSLGLLLLGSGATQVSAGGESFNALDELNKDGNGSLSEANAVGSQDKAGDLGYQDYVLVTEKDPKTGVETSSYKLVDRTDSAASGRINSGSEASLGNRLSADGATTYKHETVARASASNVQVSGAAKVHAEDALYSRNLTGNAVLGASAGVGGAFALTLSNARVSAELLGSNLQAESLDLLAKAGNLNGSPAVDVQALSGAAGFAAGLGAAVGVAVMNNQVTASLAGTVQTDGLLKAAAEDLQSLKVNSLGAAAGVGVGAGLVLGVAAHDSVVALNVANGAVLKGTDINLAATSSGAVELQGRGAAGGILAGVNATVLVARDQSKATLAVADNAQLLATQALTLRALAAPKITASSLGVAIGGYLSAGASVIDALAKANASLTLGSGSKLQAINASLSSDIGRQGDADSVNISGLGVSGGIGLSANAVVANARNESSSKLQSETTTQFIGLYADTAKTTGGSWLLSASSDVRQRAKTEGYAVGLLTLGAHFARATADTSTQALVNGRFSGAAGTLKVGASSLVDNLASATAGQGGLVSGAAATAITRDNSTTKAQLYTRGADGNSNTQFKSVELGALHQSTFNAFVNSINASLIGASGSAARNDVTLTTTAELLGGSRMETYAYEQRARSDVSKPDSDTFNVVSGSGGIVDAAAAQSISEIALNTQALVGNNAFLHLIGDFRSPQNLLIHAYNSVTARDKVKLDSGGAISIALAKSQVNVSKADAKVSIGTAANLMSIGDIVLSASGDYDIATSANAKTYGLAGAAQGYSLAKVKAVYDVDLASDSTLLGYGDIHLYAGQNVNGSSSQATLTARTDLWNNTAFPVVNKPDADATYERTSTITVNSDALVNSVGDIYAYADKGYGNLLGKGIAKDLYTEALNAIGISVEISSGKSTNTSNAVVKVDGALNSGYYNKRSVHIAGLEYWVNGSQKTLAEIAAMDIDENSSDQIVIKPVVTTSDDNITYRLVEGTYSQYISSRVAQINKQLADYGLSTVERTAMEAERNLLQQTLNKLFTEMGGTGDGASLSRDQAIQIFELDPILAKPGSVYVIGDALIGSGRLNAPGDAEIKVTNESSAFLRILGLEIPYREGGQLLFNQASLGSVAAINTANTGAYKGQATFSQLTVSASSPDPQVEVINTYNPNHGVIGQDGLRAPAPDIYIDGRIFNQRGLVKVTASYGSVYANADIRGKTLQISAGRDFVLNSDKAFFHVGGDPATNNSGGLLTGPAAGSGVVAGNNVVISAQYLNINGLIQSGVASWTAAITGNSSLDNQINVGRALYKAGYGAATIQLVNTDARTGTLGYSYDFRSESIVLDAVEVAGGYMELTGYIMSTGNGKLSVLDGYSQVGVSNSSNYTLSLAGIDLGTGTQGTLRINDVRREGGIEKVWSSIYTRDLGKIMLQQGYSSEVLGKAKQLVTDGRSTIYTPLEGRSYVWLSGQDRTNTTISTYYKDKFWGAFNVGEGTLYEPPKVYNTDPRVIDGAEYMGTDTSSPRGSVTQKEEILSSDTPNTSTETWSTCKVHFIWCQVKRAWLKTTVVQGQKVINRYSVRADNPINISFIGADAGSINVNSTGSVVLLGSLFNQNGNTSISTQGSLTQAASGAVVQANNLTLAAGTGIGSSSQAVTVQVGGLLSASSTTGDIVLRGINGGLNLSKLEALRGNVALTAQGTINTRDNDVTIKGHAIKLVSTHGGIGASGRLLNIDTNTDNGAISATPATLSAQAVDGVFLNEVSGNLLVDQVIAGSDVHLKVSNGDLIDANTSLSYDERTLDELKSLWSDMGLTGTAAADALAQQKDALINAGQSSYERYWQLRNNQIYDLEQVKLSAAQIAQLKAQDWSDAHIATEQLRLNRDYEALHAQFGGGLYDAGYQYQLSAADLAKLDKTAAWSEDQLQYSMSSALLSRGTDTQAKIEEMNIQGRNVTLDAYRVGQVMADDMYIDLSVGIGNLSKAQLAALAGAELDDVYFENDAKTKLRIVQRDDVNIAASGNLTVTAQKDVYIGGERDFNIYNVKGDTVRIKTDGNIESANGRNVVVTGHDVVLESSSGSIGGQGALNIDVSGNLTARARLLNLSTAGNLSIQRLTGLDSLTLNVGGKLLASGQNGEHLLGGAIDLTVGDDLGAAGNRVQLNSQTDSIVLDVEGNAWIGGMQGVNVQAGTLDIAKATVGGTLDIGQTNNLNQRDNWTLGSLLINVGNNWSSAVGTGVVATHAIAATAGNLATLGDLQVKANDARLDISAKSITSNASGVRWQSADLLKLDATGTAGGTGNIGSATRHALLQALRLDVDASSQLFLDLATGIQSGSLNSVGNQTLFSLGNLNLTQVDSSTGRIWLNGSGLVDIGQLSAEGVLDLQGESLTLGSAQSRTSDLLIDFTGDLLAGSLTADSKLMIDANNAEIGTATVGSTTAMTLAGDLQLAKLLAGDDAVLKMGSGSQIGLLDVSGDLDLQVNGKLNLTQAEVSGLAKLAHTGLAGSKLHYGELNIGNTLSVTGPGDWSGDKALVNNDVLFDVGSADLGSLQSEQGKLSLKAAKLFAADSLRSDKQSVELNAGSADLGEVLAKTTLTANTNGNLRILSGRSGKDLTLTTLAGSLGHINFGVRADANAPGVLDKAHLHSDENLIVDADGDLFGGNAEAQIDVTMTARNMDFGRVQSLTQDVLLTADGLQAEGNGNIVGLLVEGKRDVGIVAGGNLTMPEVKFGRGYSLKAGRDLRVGIGGNLDVNGLAEAGRDLFFTIGGNIDLQGIKAGRDVHVTSGGFINIDDRIDAGGLIDVLARGGDITVGKGIYSTGMYEGQAIAADVTINAKQGVTSAAIFADGGNIDVQGGAALNIDALRAKGNIDLLAGGLIKVAGSSISGGYQDWNAKTSIDFGRVEADQQVSLLAGTDITGDLVSASLIDIQGRNLRIADLRSGSDIDLLAGGLIKVAGSSTSGGYQDWNAKTSIDFGRVQADQQVSLLAGTDITGDFVSASLIDIQGRDLRITDLRSGSDIDLLAGGLIKVAGSSTSGGYQDWSAKTSIDFGSLQAIKEATLLAGQDITGTEVSASLVNIDGHSLRITDLTSDTDTDLLARGLIRVNGTSQSGGYQNWQADESIFFERLLAGGQALLDSLLSTEGRELRADQGTVIHAGWRKGVASDADILLGKATAPTMSLWAGSLIRVADANIGQSVDLHGKEIELYGRHTGSGQLNLWVEGSGEKLAKRFDTRLDAADILSPRLHAVDSRIETTGSKVDLQDAVGVDHLSLYSAQAVVIADNTTPAYRQNADVQLYELDKAFQLKQDGLTSTTTGYVLHRKFTHQVLVQNFSEAHASLPGEGMLYQGISAARYSEQNLSNGFTEKRIANILLQLAPALPASQWAPNWSTTPVENRINLDIGAQAPREDGAQAWEL